MSMCACISQPFPLPAGQEPAAWSRAAAHRLGTPALDNWWNQWYFRRIWDIPWGADGQVGWDLVCSLAWLSVWGLGPHYYYVASRIDSEYTLYYWKAPRDEQLKETSEALLEEDSEWILWTYITDNLIAIRAAKLFSAVIVSTNNQSVLFKVIWPCLDVLQVTGKVQLKFLGLSVVVWFGMSLSWWNLRNREGSVWC